jgi:hypothetical protein
MSYTHSQSLCIIKHFGFPITIRKMTAFEFVQKKAIAGDKKAIECLNQLTKG